MLRKQVTTILAYISAEKLRVPYAEWSLAARDEVQANYVDDLVDGKMERLFNGKRDTLAVEINDHLSVKFNLDQKTAEVVGKVRNVKSYVNSYIHNFYGRNLKPLANVMWTWTGEFNTI